MELQLWNAPAFKTRFAESYLAETEIEPRVTLDERDKLQEVFDLIASDQLDKAARVLEKHLGRDSGDSDKRGLFGGAREEKSGNGAAGAVFDFTLGNIYFQQEKLSQAAELYQTAVEKYPKFRRAWGNLALILVRQGEFARARPALIRVIELGGGDAVNFGLLGYACSALENDLSAESAYRMAILLDPATKDWQLGLARSLFKQERYAEAAALCKNLIADQPERAELWLLQANAYIGLNQPLKAAENLELVDRLGRATADSLYLLGDIYVNHELYALAVGAYTRALERNAADDSARVLRAAQALLARGALAETRLLIERIENLRGERLAAGERKELLKLRARLAVAEGGGDEEEARILEEVVQLDPLDGEALILLGQHCSRKGDREKAIFYFERAAAIDQFEPDAKVRHAQLLVADGKYDEALPLLRRAQQLKPRDNIQKYLEQVERVAKSR